MHLDELFHSSGEFVGLERSAVRAHGLPVPGKLQGKLLLPAGLQGLVAEGAKFLGFDA